MKKNIYFKAQFTTQTDEEALYNTFPIYAIITAELFIIAILQGEINIISISLLIMSTIMACRMAYQIGQNSTR